VCVCVCVCVCVFVYIYTHTHTHTHIVIQARGKGNIRFIITIEHDNSLKDGRIREQIRIINSKICKYGKQVKPPPYRNITL